MKTKLASFGLAVSAGLTLAHASVARAAFSGGVQAGADSARGADQPTNLFGMGGMFQTVSNVLLFLVGAIAVVMIIYGGIRYVLSGGDSNNVSAAKNTILYALVGVIVAILAYSVVNFVIGSFTGTGGPGASNI